MKITRHFVDVGQRRVHYRRCGQGPALLMIHQSPRSSAEYEPLMRQWGDHFTCIAPDTPGFGQSDPLPDADAPIGDFADALVAFLDALGLDKVPAYGFHSGGIILVNALKRHPSRFAALAVGGYAIWTPEESRAFSESYLPPFQPKSYGDHLTWLWNRILEQTWFFPWFAAAPEARMTVAHAEPARVDHVVREMLDSGDAYRVGYGAVLSASRDIPADGEPTAPVLISAYTGDVLQDHIDRLGRLPASWEARKVDTPADHQTASLEWLAAHAGPAIDTLEQASDEGFLPIAVGGFDGLIHWRGARDGVLYIHGPGRALELLGNVDGIAIDLPGHGLSSPWPGNPPVDRASWQAVIEAVVAALRCTAIVYEDAPLGDAEALFPDLSPDRFGAYLTRAWSIVRARHLFAPWYDAGPAAAIAFDPEDIAPEKLRIEHRALMRSTAARQWLLASRQRVH